MITLPGEPPTWVVRIPAWRRWLPPGPCAGWVGGAIARVAEGAADPGWSGAEPPAVHPATTRATSRPATRRLWQVLGLPRPGPTMRASMISAMSAVHPAYIYSEPGASGLLGLAGRPDPGTLTR
jgi:hypothetical protein